MNRVADSPHVATLADILRLADRLRVSPPRGRRAEAAFALAGRLAELGGAPVPLPWIGEHVIGDQLALTAYEWAQTNPDPGEVAEVRSAVNEI
jgi:hypothetical protein